MYKMILTILFSFFIFNSVVYTGLLEKWHVDNYNLGSNSHTFLLHNGGSRESFIIYLDSAYETEYVYVDVDNNQPFRLYRGNNILVLGNYIRLRLASPISAAFCNGKYEHFGRFDWMVSHRNSDLSDNTYQIITEDHPVDVKITCDSLYEASNVSIDVDNREHSLGLHESTIVRGHNIRLRLANSLTTAFSIGKFEVIPRNNFILSVENIHCNKVTDGNPEDEIFFNLNIQRFPENNSVYGRVPNDNDNHYDMDEDSDQKRNKCCIPLHEFTLNNNESILFTIMLSEKDGGTSRPYQEILSSILYEIDDPITRTSAVILDVLNRLGVNFFTDTDDLIGTTFIKVKNENGFLTKSVYSIHISGNGNERKHIIQEDFNGDFNQNINYINFQNDGSNYDIKFRVY